MGYIYFLTKSLFSTMMNFAINLRVELYTIGFDFIVQMFKIFFFLSFMHVYLGWEVRGFSGVCPCDLLNLLQTKISSEDLPR